MTMIYNFSQDESIVLALQVNKFMYVKSQQSLAQFCEVHSHDSKIVHSKRIGNTLAIKMNHY